MGMERGGQIEEIISGCNEWDVAVGGALGLCLHCVMFTWFPCTFFVPTFLSGCRILCRGFRSKAPKFFHLDSLCNGWPSSWVQFGVGGEQTAAAVFKEFNSGPVFQVKKKKKGGGWAVEGLLNNHLVILFT